MSPEELAKAIQEFIDDKKSGGVWFTENDGDGITEVEVMTAGVDAGTVVLRP